MTIALISLIQIGITDKTYMVGRCYFHFRFPELSLRLQTIIFVYIKMTDYCINTSLIQIPNISVLGVGISMLDFLSYLSKALK